jgi:hypothetical protein
MKAALTSLRKNCLSQANPIDLQQLIDTRLRSIDKHLPRGVSDGKALDSPERLAAQDLQEKMSKQLSQWRTLISRQASCPLVTFLVGAASGRCSGRRMSTGEFVAVKLELCPCPRSEKTGGAEIEPRASSLPDPSTTNFT